MPRHFEFNFQLKSWPQSNALGSAAAEPTDINRRFQFNMRRILIAFVWVALWGTSWVVGPSLIDDPRGAMKFPSQFLFCLLLTATPAAAIGAFSGRHALGLFCGLGSAVALMTWIFFVE